eukprot:Skav222942  [mRNA]  locus=scaffold1489:518304:520536:- [translate_table: standard]
MSSQECLRFGCSTPWLLFQANRILLFVSTAFEGAVPAHPTRKGYASQAVYGQLLLALIFDDSSCEVRDRTLVASVQAVYATFGQALGSLDERLARQLQVVELACRVERPAALQTLETKGLTYFLEGVKKLEESDSLPLPKCSSQQHLQVSGALQELGVKHRMEVPSDTAYAQRLIHTAAPLECSAAQEKLQPYIADVRLTRGQGLIEIDGLLAAILKEVEQVLATSRDLASLLRSAAPGKHLMEYNPQSNGPLSPESRFQELRELESFDAEVM